MPDTTQTRRIIRFGIYEADLIAGELRKNGRKVRLQEQPFQILALLLERSGEVVTREEIQQKLWPGDTFVDFDHGLNTAINKVRAALADSAINPRFVETLSKRGYRFLAPTQLLNDPSVDEINSERTVTRADLKTATADKTAGRIHAQLHVPMPRRWLVRTLFAAIQMMYLVFYLEALVRWSHAEMAASRFVSEGAAFWVAIVVLVSGALGIVWRCYLLSAIGFDYRLLRRSFERVFPAAMLLDELWALAPFLIIREIGFGAAFAAMAALLYVPFAERTLLRMTYEEHA